MRQILSYLGLTVPMVYNIVKGAMPATIATAMALSPVTATVYGNFGFIITIGSILSLHLLPRNRFLENILMATFFTCLAAAWILLSHFTGFRARQHTTPPDEPLSGYNQAASATNAVFLALAAWFLSSLRAAFPQYTIPLLICTIFCMVGIMLGPEIVSLQSSFTTVRQLLVSYLTGFGLSAAVGLVCFPRTSRSVFLILSNSFLAACQELLEAEQSLFESSIIFNTTEDGHHSVADKSASRVGRLGSTVVETMAQLTEELQFAKTELAFGYFSPKMLTDRMVCLQALLIPLLGLSRASRTRQQFPETLPLLHAIKTTSSYFEETRDILEKAIRHALLLAADERLLNSRNAHTSQELEESSNSPNPGDLGYTEFLQQRLHASKIYLRQSDVGDYNAAEEETSKEKSRHQTWLDPSTAKPEEFEADLQNTNEAYLRQLQHHLFQQHLLESVAKAACELAEYAESVHTGSKQAQLWVTPVGGRWSISGIQRALRSRSPEGETVVQVDITRSLEHRLPSSSFELFTERVRFLLRIFLSNSSQFGLRVAAATMSLGIVGFLPQSQQFFVEYRIVWAMVMTPISMSPTSGNAIYGFLGRLAGTVFAMVMAYANWYIVDANPAGIVVFFFISMLIYYFLLLKFPRFIIVFILAAVNHVLIVGYELQAEVNGAAKSTGSGPIYFPLYILAPYRLLSVIAGLLVSLFWTLFPSQISERAILHSKMNASLSHLLNYCALVMDTLHQRVHKLEGNPASESSLGRQMKSARYKTLYQELSLLGQMRNHSSMTVYEVSLGGKFPKKEFDIIIEEIQRMVALLSVIPYVSQGFQVRDDTRVSDEHDLRRSEHAIRESLTAIIPVVSIIASSMVTGASLPPRLSLRSASVKLLEPSIHSDAVTTIIVAVSGISESVEKMLQTMKGLVGELSFGIEQGP